VSDDAVVGHRVVEEPAAGRRDYNVLPAVASFVGRRRGFCGASEFHRPQFLAVLCIEGTESCVIGCSDEYQASGSRDGAAVAGAPRILLAFGHAVSHAKRHAPGKFAGVYIDRGELTPWRLLAGQLLPIRSFDAEASAAFDAFVNAVRIDAI